MKESFGLCRARVTVTTWTTFVGSKKLDEKIIDNFFLDNFLLDIFRRI